MTEQLALDGFNDEADSVEAILKWIGRSYQTMEEWKLRGKEVFFSVNGDSNVARNRFASIVRAYFGETTLQPDKVSRWATGSTAITEVVVTVERQLEMPSCCQVRLSGRCGPTGPGSIRWKRIGQRSRHCSNLIRDLSRLPCLAGCSRNTICRSAIHLSKSFLTRCAGPWSVAFTSGRFNTTLNKK